MHICTMLMCADVRACVCVDFLTVFTGWTFAVISVYLNNASFMMKYGFPVTELWRRFYLSTLIKRDKIQMNCRSRNRDASGVFENSKFCCPQSLSSTLKWICETNFIRKLEHSINTRSHKDAHFTHRCTFHAQKKKHVCCGCKSAVVALGSSLMSHTFIAISVSLEKNANANKFFQPLYVPMNSKSSEPFTKARIVHGYH